MPDLFAFTSKVSLDAPVVKMLPDTTKDKLRVIRSCVGIPEGSTELCSKVAPFQIGYVGTIEPAKMHPDFLELCAAANIASTCIVAGGPMYKELRSKAIELGLADRFEILGYVSDPRPIFERIHALAYPLVPGHYGTGEQVIIEAMAFGAVPVVLANPPENALIRHNETGLVAENAAEFSAALRFLADNPAERDRIASSAHRFVMEKCDIKLSQNKFYSFFDELASFPKRARRLSLAEVDGIKPGSPFHLFLSSLGKAPECDVAMAIASQGKLCGPPPPSFLLSTRGSPKHYLSMLGPDQNLERICKICDVQVER